MGSLGGGLRGLRRWPGGALRVLRGPPSDTRGSRKLTRGVLWRPKALSSGCRAGWLGDSVGGSGALRSPSSGIEWRCGAPLRKWEGSSVPSAGSALVLVPLLAVSDVPSEAETEAVEAVSGAVTVPALQLRRPDPGAVVVVVVSDLDPRLQAREQKIRPPRGRKGRPSRGRPQRLQQKQRSEACQCWPS